MSRPTEFYTGTAITWTIACYTTTGALVDADSNPTIVVYKGGVATGESVTVTKRAATTGLYDCSFNPAGDVVGSIYSFEETLTVSAVAFANEPWNCFCMYAAAFIEAAVDEVITGYGLENTETFLMAIPNNAEFAARTLLAADYFDFTADTVDANIVSVTGTAVTDVDDFKTGGTDPATGAKQDEILAKLAAQANGLNTDLDPTSLSLIHHDTYDGVTNVKKSWATDKDYTAPEWSIKLVITEYDSDTVINLVDGEAESSSLVSIPTLTAEFGPDLEFVGCPSTATLRFAVVAIHDDSNQETIAYGDCEVARRGTVV